MQSRQDVIVFLIYNGIFKCILYIFFFSCNNVIYLPEHGVGILYMNITCSSSAYIGLIKYEFIVVQISNGTENRNY